MSKVNKVEPLQDRVVVKLDEAESRTRGGIIIPDVARKDAQQGLVVAVGPGKVEHGAVVPVQAQVGQKVLLERYAGTSFKNEGEEFTVIQDCKILAVLHEDEQP